MNLSSTTFSILAALLSGVSARKSLLAQPDVENAMLVDVIFSHHLEDLLAQLNLSQAEIPLEAKGYYFPDEWESFLNACVAVSFYPWKPLREENYDASRCNSSVHETRAVCFMLSNFTEKVPALFEQVSNMTSAIALSCNRSKNSEMREDIVVNENVRNSVNLINETVASLVQQIDRVEHALLSLRNISRWKFANERNALQLFWLEAASNCTAFAKRAGFLVEEYHSRRLLRFKINEELQAMLLQLAFRDKLKSAVAAYRLAVVQRIETTELLKKFSNLAVSIDAIEGSVEKISGSFTLSSKTNSQQADSVCAITTQLSEALAKLLIACGQHCASIRRAKTIGQDD